MSKELIVSSLPHETRVAIVEDDQLVEVYIEQESRAPLAGSIYKGRVTRVLPGMQSAFVNIGLERDAFLYVSDFFEESEGEADAVEPKRKTTGGWSRRGPRQSSEPASAVASKDGDEGDGGGAAGESGKPARIEAAAAESRPEQPRRGDRRGRRSRRGRGVREDGFPESKYAAVDSERGGRPPRSGSQPGTPLSPGDSRGSSRSSDGPRSGEGAGPDEFVVLPGESLAKHRGAANPAAAEADKGDAPASLEPLEQVSAGAAELIEDAAAEQAPASDPVQANASEQAESDGEISSADGCDSAPAEDLGENSDPEPASPDVSLDEAVGEAVRLAEESLGPEKAGEIGDDELAALIAPLEDETGKPEADGTEASGTPESASESADADFDLGASAAETEAGTDHRESPADPAPLSKVFAKDPVEDERGSAEAAKTDSEAVDAVDSDEAESDAAGAGGDAAQDGGPDGAEGGEARVRAASKSSRYATRRGRRGRRRSGRGRPAEAPAEDAAAEVETNGDRPPGPQIADLLSKGQEILVQIAKEPLGRKGARITSHIALPGRYLVYMPTVEHIGVSRKIASDAERMRLRKAVDAHRTGMPGGFIARTAASGVDEEQIRGDMEYLYNLWLDMRSKAERSSAPTLVHQDLNVMERVLRDRLQDDFKTIWVEGEEEYERILRFVERFQSDLLSRVKLYTREAPIFDEFSLTQELEKALRPKVWLKSGGYIVINQTEALVAIDVNTGKYVGKSDRLEDTIVNTNLEAVKELVRQVRLRDLGGIIVIDFIDMDDRKNRQKVMIALDEELRNDRAPSKALQFNEFGLVAITRKRVKQSLERALCTPCPYCSGSAFVKSVPTVIQEILVEGRKMAQAAEGEKDFTLRVNPEVARVLKSRGNNYLQELEQILKANIIIRGDASLHREHFGIQ